MIAKADKPLSGKEDAAIEQYTHPGSETKGNWCQSYLLGGYAKCKGWETNAIRVLQKDYIQAEITRRRAETVKEMGMTVEKMHNQYDEDRAFARSNKQPSAMISASVATARLYGMDKDNDMHNADSPAQLTQADIDIVRTISRTLTDNGLRAASGPTPEDIAC